MSIAPKVNTHQHTHVKKLRVGILHYPAEQSEDFLRQAAAIDTMVERLTRQGVEAKSVEDYASKITYDEGECCRTN